MNEIWKDIKGFEGLYQVSNLGRVKRLGRLMKYENREGFYCAKEQIINGTAHGKRYSKSFITSKLCKKALYTWSVSVE